MQLEKPRSSPSPVSPSSSVPSARTAAIVDGLAPHRRRDGSYRLSNEYRYVIARA